MFRNVGKKIKILAKVTFWVLVVAFIVISIFLMSDGETVTIILGILLLLLGPFLSLIFTWFIYGYGELIDKTCDIKRKICGEDTPAAPKLHTPIEFSVDEILNFQDTSDKAVQDMPAKPAQYPAQNTPTKPSAQDIPAKPAKNTSSALEALFNNEQLLLYNQLTQNSHQND